MNFKKQISIIIAILVLVSNSGLAFNVHFCEGKIASLTSVFSKEEVCDMSMSELAKQIPIQPEKTCCAKEETSHKNCCSDKEVNLKNNTEKVTIKVSFDSEIAFTFQEIKHLVLRQIQIINPTEKVDYYCDANAPPLYLLYRQYTFYA